MLTSRCIDVIQGSSGNNWFNKVISMIVDVSHDICFQKLNVSLCFKRKESYQLVSFIKLKTANINIYSAYLVCFILH